MLEKVTHIEGFEGFQSTESPDDTNPGAMLVEFYVESEVMPYLSEQAGQEVRRNFVRLKETINLGNLINDRRIRDEVEYVESERRWKVKKLHPSMSDIRKYPDYWNAFARDQKDIVIGTPLTLMFKHDPSLVERYKANHIYSIEQLAAVTDANCDQLFMGAKKNRDEARAYLRRIQETAPSIQINNRMDELESTISAKDRQIAELTSRLDEILRSQIAELEPKKKTAGRKPKSEPEIDTHIEGLE